MAITSKFVFNPFTGNFDSTLDVNLSYAQVKYVDKANTFTYTADGSIDKPFKSIEAMYNAITDASASKRYAVVIAPGTYTEAATIRIKGWIDLTSFATDTVIIAVAGGVTLKWSNNDPGRVFIRDIGFTSGFEILNDNPTGTSGLVFDLDNVDAPSIVFNGRGGGRDFIQLRNDTRISGSCTIRSAATTIFDSTNISNLIMNDVGCVAPDTFGSAITASLRSNYIGSIQITATTYDVYTDIWGTIVAGNLNITSNALSYPCYFNHDATSYPLGTITLTGSNPAQVVATSVAQAIRYTPALPGNWSTVPTTVAEGLDTLETDKFDYPTGLTSQYVRGDGTLANFPTSSGGGSSVSYYLNGGIASSVATYYQMSKTAIIGSGADFTVTSGITTLAAQFMTDAGDPDLLAIPAGNWTFDLFFSASSGGGSPTFYVELYKYDGTTSTLISSGSGFPEGITAGTAIDLYITALAVPATSLALTDRLEVRVYVTRDGRDITLHTQNGHLCQIITTFSTGLNALNGLTDQVQYFATGTTGTDFTINSSGDTHTFDIPDASALSRGLLTSTDWSDFDGRVNTASNVGAGEEVFKQKTGVDLEFKSLVAGVGISLSSDASEITIENTLTPVTAEIPYIIQTFSGDALTTDFTLTTPCTVKESLLVFIDGVYQEQTAYSYASPIVSFTSAPPTGTNNIEVRFQTTDAVILDLPKLEIYNTTIAIPFGVATMTGILHCKVPYNSNIVITQVQLFEKNGVVSGTLEVDVKKNSTPNNTGMASIFSAKPSFNFATASDYDVSTGVVGTSTITTGEYLRLDITSVPSGFVGNIQVAVYAA